MDFKKIFGMIMLVLMFISGIGVVILWSFLNFFISWFFVIDVLVC